MKDRLNKLEKSPSQVRQEAANWFARVLCGNLSDQDQIQFQEWLNASPVHRRELDRLDVLWRFAPAAAEVSPNIEDEGVPVCFKWHLTDAWRLTAFREPRGWDVSGPSVIHRLAGSAPSFLL